MVQNMLIAVKKTAIGARAFAVIVVPKKRHSRAQLAEFAVSVGPAAGCTATVAVSRGGTTPSIPPATNSSCLVSVPFPP